MYDEGPRYTSQLPIALDTVVAPHSMVSELMVTVVLIWRSNQMMFPTLPWFVPPTSVANVCEVATEEIAATAKRAKLRMKNSKNGK
ncbi:hypothetical protein LBMAG49_27880 [Planctomycetota bacterium]|nr:hypothetical protein LBMAG49_27880 [Planctomycetota bacterium]